MAPLTQEEFSDYMATCMPEGMPVALACSGGPDSMALALLLRDWCEDRNASLTALIVDHGLRPESAQEAAQVRGWLAEADVEAQILTRTDDEPIKSDIQNRARSLRYSLLTDWCRANEVRDLFLAHHLDDQAETFMIRLARGSGVDGLAVMTPHEIRQGVNLHRPLLSVPKARLVAILDEAGQDYVRDPSNESDAFTRVRWRKLMPGLAEEGLTAERLHATAMHMQRASAALASQRQRHLDRSGRLFPDGSCRLVLKSFLDADDDIILRSLAFVLQAMTGADYVPRFGSLSRVLGELKSTLLRDGQGFDSTLAGCRLALRRDVLWIAREFAAIGEDLPLNKVGRMQWDGRFDVDVQVTMPGFRLGPLGPDGWQGLRRSHPDFVVKTAHFPAFVRHVWPGLWQGDALVEPIWPLDGQVAEKMVIQLRSGRFFGSSAFSSPAWNTM
ncbi:tRNA lysidine(34) synthetase TilS [Aestuariispira ectoiniformans]|uniref:tRNA lysidine(34) synthetase TilS n=1 Tax=Aestuariispira ectoiniformans TaxID=2775080 RepID=UPI00223B65D1|nr:tRNA lysidine(34) synthetase TilS [Aestuariispira ectoiniformans]